MRDWLVAQGVETARITLEPRARVTAENALFVAPILRQLGATEVSLVTDAFHMRRSLVLLRAALCRYGMKSVHIRAVPTDDNKRGAARVWLAINEWHKTLWSLARLYLSGR